MTLAYLIYKKSRMEGCSRTISAALAIILWPVVWVVVKDLRHFKDVAVNVGVDE